jgi:hypothetical protein
MCHSLPVGSLSCGEFMLSHHKLVMLPDEPPSFDLSLFGVAAGFVSASESPTTTEIGIVGAGQISRQRNSRIILDFTLERGIE